MKTATVKLLSTEVESDELFGDPLIRWWWELSVRDGRFVRTVRCRDEKTGLCHCEWCGAVNGQPHPITGSIVVLTTAHVYDDRPESAGLLNLAGLCQKCHNGHDNKSRRINRKRRLEKLNGVQTLF